MKLLVTADWHARQHLYPERLAEQEAVFTRIVQLADELGCAAILHGGDFTESRTPTNDERAAFQRPLASTRVPVVAIPGNHDVKDVKTPTALDLAGQECGGRIRVSRYPELIDLGGAVVATLPHFPSHWIVARLNESAPRDSINAVVEGELVKIARILYAEACEQFPGVPVFLLGHWPCEGAPIPSGGVVSRDFFKVPVVDPWLLSDIGFASVWLGDIHAPGRIDGTDVYSISSPMQLDHGEARCDHGVWVADTEAEPEFVPLTAREFVTLESAPEDLIEGFWPGDVSGDIVKVRCKPQPTLDQNRRIDRPALTAALYAAGAKVVTLDIVPASESRARVAGVTADLSPLDAVDLWAAAQGLDASLAKAVRGWTGEALEAVA